MWRLFAKGVMLFARALGLGERVVEQIAPPEPRRATANCQHQRFRIPCPGVPVANALRFCKDCGARSVNAGLTWHTARPQPDESPP